ncbi:MAG: GNAT family N-acetyltransferase [Maricaulaceae bacterium]
MTENTTHNMGLPETIHGTTLTLRPLRLSDAARFSEYANDMEVARMTGTIPCHFPLLAAEFRLMYMASQTRRGLAYNYAITKCADDELIGIASLFRASQDDIFELGYSIAKSAWGHGYATTSAQMLIKAANAHLGITRLKAGVFADNPASLRVLQKLGFEQQGPIDMFFSMARLKKAPSINLVLKLTDKLQTSGTASATVMRIVK